MNFKEKSVFEINSSRLTFFFQLTTKNSALINLTLKLSKIIFLYTTTTKYYLLIFKIIFLIK